MKQGKNILLAGATGFVGKALVDNLINLNHSLTVISRNTAKAKSVFHSKVEVMAWPKTAEDLSHWSNKEFDAIINLTGASIADSPWTTRYKEVLLSSRVNSISNLNKIYQALNTKPLLWLQFSAIGYYGHTVLEPTDETGEKGGGFLSDLVEQWEDDFNKLTLNGTKKISLRLGVVLADNGGFLKQLSLPFKFGLAFYAGNKHHLLSYIWMDNLLKLITEILQNPNYASLINAVEKEPLSQINLLNKLAPKHSIKLGMPAFALRLLLGKEKANELALANQNVISKVLAVNNFYL